jgi:hypothetical protein
MNLLQILTDHLLQRLKERGIPAYPAKTYSPLPDNHPARSTTRTLCITPNQWLADIGYDPDSNTAGISHRGNTHNTTVDLNNPHSIDQLEQALERALQHFYLTGAHKSVPTGPPQRI